VAAEGDAHPVRWTGGPAGQAGCGSCHGIPPPTHPPTIRSATQCAGCHAGAIDPTGLPNADRHVNGTVDVVAQNENACSGCHGDRTAQGVPPGDPRSAPPGDRDGNAATPAVGAHAVHVRSPRFSSPVACRECHVVPFTVLQAGHIDAAPAEVAFGALARTRGAAPAYAASTRGCSSTYCHGAFNGGAGANAVTWGAGAAAAACGSCHALPPPTPPHPATGTSSCGVVGCHSGYGATPGDQTMNRAAHINGRIDLQ
jgi:predicted CxxxxCH...CXXCH cytochrome family protein